MQFSGNEQRSFFRHFLNAAILCMHISAAVALVDVSCHLAFGDQIQHDSFSMIWKQLSVAIFVYGSLYILLVFLVGALALLLSRHWPGGTSHNVAVFVVSLASTILISDLVLPFAEPATFKNEIFQLGSCAVISFLAVGLWVRTTGTKPGRQGNSSLAVLSFAVAALVETFVYMMVVRTGLVVVSPIISGVTLIGIITLSGAVILVWSSGWQIGMVAALLTFLLGLAPLPLAISQNMFSPDPIEARSDDLAIEKVILITIDTMRADLLSAAAPESGVTDRIDGLAEDSVIFTQARSPAPWTKPSVCSILTGLSPSVHQVLEREDRLPDSIDTWAERFYEAGYQTAAFGFNHNLAAKHNTDQGFQTYRWYPNRLIPTPPFQYGLASHIVGTPYARIVTNTDSLTSMASDWLTRNKNRNFFLWVHYLDPHMPYTPPPRFSPEDQVPPEGMDAYFEDLVGVRRGLACRLVQEREWVRGLYRSEMKYVDDQVGRLLDTLRSLGIYDETLLVLTSDHGEEFWEHGGFEHGHALFEEELRVPLLIKLPESRATRRVEVPVSLEDILPTVMDLCEMDHDQHDFSGMSLTRLWDDSSHLFPRRAFFASKPLYYEPCDALLVGNLKCIRYFETNRELIFDLQSDPLEQSPINPSREVLERIEAARGNLARIHERLRDRYGTHEQEKVVTDSWDAEQVRALGYL